MREITERLHAADKRLEDCCHCMWQSIQSEAELLRSLASQAESNGRRTSPAALRDIADSLYHSAQALQAALRRAERAREDQERRDLHKREEDGMLEAGIVSSRKAAKVWAAHLRGERARKDEVSHD